MEEDTEINDLRSELDFRIYSFSNFKKTEVIKQLLINLNQNKVEPSLYWSVELICAGHFLSLWETIINYYSKYIQLSNPKLITYLELRYNNFKYIYNNGYQDCELKLRNNNKIRRLFSELICILCLSKKHHIFQEIKINPFDFILINISDKLKAPNIDFIEPYYKPEDPKLLFIPFNEFVYNLSIKNCIETCYWLEYILEFEINIKKKKESIICERRTYPNVDIKMQKDIIWIFWEILLDYAEKHSLLSLKILKSAFNIFCIKYSPILKQKRKYLLYFVITFISSNILYEQEIVKDKEMVLNIISKIDKIYLQVKKNEIGPKTDYLFKGMKNKNFEKTIQRLEQLNNFSEIFIPRDNKNIE
jgi:hypothetical protein